MASTTSPLAALRRMFARSRRPMYALDQQGRLVFANDALAEWTGLPLSELLELHCVWDSGQAAPHGALAAGLSPPPSALLRGQRRMVVEIPVFQGANLQWRRRMGDAITWEEEHLLEAVFVMLDAEDCGEHEAELPLSPSALHQQVLRLRQRLGEPSAFQLLGESAPMRRVRHQVEAAAKARANVLIVGQPGVGREEVAKTIYYRGEDNTGLLPLSSQLLDPELLASALEDLERSHLELVEGPNAILLLDADLLPKESQDLVYQRIRRLDPAPRLLATSRRPLLERDFHREFALYLSELTIELPTLSERRDDVPLLAQFVLQNYNSDRHFGQGRTSPENRSGRSKQLAGFEPDAIDLLIAYPWFENHAELSELVRSACRQSAGPLVGVADLPHSLHAARQQAAHPVREEEPIDLPAWLEDAERELIRRALSLAKGNKAHAARLLGLRRSRLLRRLEALGLAEEAGADD